MTTARGTFEVNLTPCSVEPAEGADAVARLTVDKSYSGQLVGTGRGQMLSCTTDVEGSAGYVALELVEASLDGRNGSFVLQHVGVMDRGDATLQMTVVPDSATGDLAGLGGAVDITIDDGTHHYTFTYDLPD